MYWKLDYLQEEDIFLVTTQGQFSVVGFERLAEETFAHERWRPGINLLCDHSRLAMDNVGFAEMWEVSLVHRRSEPGMGQGRSALIMPSGKGFELGRIYEALLEYGTTRKVRAFDSPEAAMAWLTPHYRIAS